MIRLVLVQPIIDSVHQPVFIFHYRKSVACNQWLAGRLQIAVRLPRDFRFWKTLFIICFTQKLRLANDMVYDGVHFTNRAYFLDKWTFILWYDAFILSCCCFTCKRVRQSSALRNALWITGFNLNCCIWNSWSALWITMFCAVAIVAVEAVECPIRRRCTETHHPSDRAKSSAAANCSAQGGWETIN